MVRFKHLSTCLLLSVFLLLGMGLAMLYSAGFPQAFYYGDTSCLVRHQLWYILIGLVGMGLLGAMDYRRIGRRIVLLICLLSLTFLFLVLTDRFSFVHAGQHRWLNIDFMAFQPADLVLLVSIIYAAWVLSREEPTKGLAPLIVPPLLLGSFLVLLFFQPHLPAVFIILGSILIMLRAGGFKKLFYSLLMFLVTVFALTAAARPNISSLKPLYEYMHYVENALVPQWKAFPSNLSEADGCRTNHHLTYPNEVHFCNDPDLNSYHCIQNVTAVGHHGPSGLGYMHSIQKWFYLPRPFSDSIFSVIAEELGLAGVVFLLAVKLMFIVIGLSIARNAPDRFGFFLAIGITAVIFFQILLHIGGCIGLMPITSTPLPFFSYSSSGSPLIFTLVGIGLLFSISAARATSGVIHPMPRSIYISIGTFFFILLFRTVELQAVHEHHLVANGIRTVQAERGDILDRNGRHLAKDIPGISIYAEPDKLGSPDCDHEILSEKHSDRPFVWLKRRIGGGEQELRRLRASLPCGIKAIREMKRMYPSKLAAHLIGFTGIDHVGLEGIEYLWETELQGDSGIRVVDGLGRPIPWCYQISKEPIKGSDVILTLDLDIQAEVEGTLARLCKTEGALQGMAVVMDANQGEILAMANWPGFDPNRFTEYSPDVWRNRVLTDPFEPGSAVLPLFAAYGWYKVLYTPMRETISNLAGFCEEMGLDLIHCAAEDYGFTTRTGIDAPRGYRRSNNAEGG